MTTVLNSLAKLQGNSCFKKLADMDSVEIVGELLFLYSSAAYKVERRGVPVELSVEREILRTEIVGKILNALECQKECEENSVVPEREGIMNQEDIQKADINKLLLRYEELSAEKSFGYTTGEIFFLDTVNNQVIPEMNLIVNEIRNRVKK